MVKKVVHNLLRISLVERHVGVRPRLIVEVNLNFLVVGASLYSGCSGVMFTSALEMGLASSTYS
jgi:hypothetical protein